MFSFLKHPVVEQVWETFEPFVDPSIRLIPFLTGAQTVGGGISPDQAQFRFMRMVEYINVRHDSKEHNEPIFALKMHALHVGERRDQRNGLRHNSPWIDFANAYGISRQFQRHLPVRKCV